jgi:hypothetical protein
MYVGGRTPQAAHTAQTWPSPSEPHPGCAYVLCHYRTGEAEIERELEPGDPRPTRAEQEAIGWEHREYNGGYVPAVTVIEGPPVL